MAERHGHMKNNQQQIIDQVESWLSENRPVWLCTILKTWGSSPRPIGSMLASTTDGEIIGSLSGGCIEEDFLAQLVSGELKARFDEDRKPFVIFYGKTEEEQARLKLPCGGQLDVLLEFIDPSNENNAVFRELVQKLSGHKRISRSIDLSNGSITARVLDDGEPRTPIKIADEVLQHELSPMYHLLLLGAGDVARYVAEISIALEYEVTLCDPRPRYLENWSVEGVHKTDALPDDVVREYYDNPYSAIVALAHDPRVDDMALMEALKTKAFYIGAMGSVKTSADRRARLPQLGLNSGEINRLHAPIGLQIGSKKPAEIAISIMAEITAARNYNELRR